MCYGLYTISPLNAHRVHSCLMMKFGKVIRYWGLCLLLLWSQYDDIIGKSWKQVGLISREHTVSVWPWGLFPVSDFFLSISCFKSARRWAALPLPCPSTLTFRLGASPPWFQTSKTMGQINIIFFKLFFWSI